MNAAQAIRDAAAKREALYQYATAHDVFADLEQRLAGTVEAAGAHEYALRTIRSWRAEHDDPEPPVPAHYRACALCDQPEYVR